MASLNDITFDAERVALEFHAHVAGLVGRTVEAHEQGTISLTADLAPLSVDAGATAFLRVKASVPRKAPHPHVGVTVYLAVTKPRADTPSVAFDGVFFLEQGNADVKQECMHSVMGALLTKLDSAPFRAPSAPDERVAAFTRIMRTISTGRADVH